MREHPIINPHKAESLQNVYVVIIVDVSLLVAQMHVKDLFFVLVLLLIVSLVNSSVKRVVHENELYDVEN